MGNQPVIENQELDQRLIEAWNERDLEKVMSLYWKGPELVLITPDGKVSKGQDEVRRGYEELFSSAESIRLEMTEACHWAHDDSVVGAGCATLYLKEKGTPEQVLTVRFADFRRKQDGKWVYLHDYAFTVV